MESLNFDILRRLVSRFDLKEVATPTPLQIPALVILTSSADELLRQSVIKSAAADLSAAAGTYVPYHVVPVGKRWRVRFYRRPTSVAVTQIRVYTVDGFYIPMEDSKTAGTVVSVCDFGMDEGWSIGLMTTGNGGDTNIGLSMIVDEEEAY